MENLEIKIINGYYYVCFLNEDIEWQILCKDEKSAKSILRACKKGLIDITICRTE